MAPATAPESPRQRSVSAASRLSSSLLNPQHQDAKDNSSLYDMRPELFAPVTVSIDVQEKQFYSKISKDKQQDEEPLRGSSNGRDSRLLCNPTIKPDMRWL
ncbi:hypothetical protein PENNAL_c0015G00819 [Penicillium nalgiovense]|uniref:Uncharacterized protein n=1 Tax=Penicillium nalgiovense TaxID=60175 RepID=A0A1V6YNJ0_PENNA|nr:hypothetical protein PENNAL_c0015G00819 [Penicillium nalgiovense]